MPRSSFPSDRELYRAIRTHDAPEYVLAAKADDLVGRDDTPANLFADAANRRYPINTKAAVWLSATLLEQEDAETREKFAGRIDAGAGWFRCEGDVAAVREKAAKDRTLDESSIPDDKYGLVEKAADGTKERRCRLLNAPEIAAAAGWLLAHRGTFEYPDRRKLAAAILRRAHEEKLELDAADDLGRIAGNGIVTRDMAKRAILARAVLIEGKDPARAKDLRLVAEHIPVEAAGRAKVAAALDEVDARYDLRAQYGPAITWPEDELFAITEKVADSVTRSFIQLSSGSVYRVRDLERLDPETLLDAMGEKIAMDCAPTGVVCDGDAMAEALPALPADQARLFDAVAKHAGIARAWRVKRASRLTRPELERLAQLA
jgi:hypothetical protein